MSLWLKHKLSISTSKSGNRVEYLISRLGDAPRGSLSVEMATKQAPKTMQDSFNADNQVEPNSISVHATN